MFKRCCGKNPWELFPKNPRGDNLWGFCLYSSTDHQREHISENTFFGPLFSLKFYDHNSMFVGVFSEMLREKYAGDMVNFSYESQLDVRNLISFIK